MDLVSLLLPIVILGVAFYLIETYVPMSPPFQTAFRIVAVVIVLLLLFRLAGSPTLLR
jgi:predicted membrane chloride channel (bestrophin family)